jgi:hypothetical protein
MYKTIEEKKSVFNECTINTEDELQEVIAQIGDKNALRFRGVCEAKYTMLSSLQRNCPSQLAGGQKGYMAALLYRVKTDKVVDDYFNNKRRRNNDLTCMALMQHLGLPTPLLDFSVDINVALSFAADGVKMNSGNDETDGYVSLYVFNKDSEFEIGYSVQQAYMNGVATGEKMLKDYREQHPNESVDASILDEVNQFIKWDDLKECEIAFVEHQPIAPAVVMLSGQKFDIENPNIARQKGCFLINLYDEAIPLEDNWNGRSIEKRDLFWTTRSDATVWPYKGAITRDKITCYDIRKDVIMSWAEKYKCDLYDTSAEILQLKKRLFEIKEKLDSEMGIGA